MKSSSAMFLLLLTSLVASSAAFIVPTLHTTNSRRSALRFTTTPGCNIRRDRRAQRGALSMSSPHLAYTLDDEVIDAPLQPVGNFILVKMFDAVSRTMGGIVLPDQAQDIPTEGEVIAAGPGRVHPLTGTLIPMCVSEGDTVLFSKWSGRKVKYNGEEHMFIMDDDLLLVYRGKELTEDSLKMVRDQVLVVTEKGETETDSGIVIAATTASKEQGSQGKVIAIGEGRTTSEGTMAKCPFQPGDIVKFREYAPIEIKIKGEAYAVVRMVDCLATWQEG